jgi:hypothetical protein
VPRWALPFGAWVVVGGIYYILCFVVLFRLLRLPANHLRATALATGSSTARPQARARTSFQEDPSDLETLDGSCQARSGSRVR